MFHTAADDQLQQDLQTQLNISLERFEYDTSQLLGQHTLEKLQNNGLDLIRNGRQVLQKLVEQVHQKFDIGAGIHRLEFHKQVASYYNADRPAYVEDGYIYLHLTERNILRYFLQQKIFYDVMLEILTDHVIRYIEKVYYRMEQYWQEFQSHFTVLEGLENLEELENLTADVAPSHNVSLEKGTVEYSVPQEPDSTEAQINQRHRRIQQLQTIARSFWQDNFAAALSQLQLDLPHWNEELEPLQAIPKIEIQPRQRVAFDPYYISLLKELEFRCNLNQQRQNLQLHLRKTLEQSLDGLAVQASENTHNEIQYTEYTEELNRQRGLERNPQESLQGYGQGYSQGYGQEYGSNQLPDELFSLNLRYATLQWLQHWQIGQEEQFIALSQQVRHFFAKVEKATRLRWFRIGAYYAFYIFSYASGIVPRFLSRSNSNATRNLSNSSNSVNRVASGKNKQKPKKEPQKLQRPQRPPKNRALEQLLKQDLQPFSKKIKYEVQLLAELLQRAELALKQQIQFYFPRNLGYPLSVSYDLLQQLYQLRQELLFLCRQPMYGHDEGIQITAFYRTVAKRRETFYRLEKILQNFCTHCS